MSMRDGMLAFADNLADFEVAMRQVMSEGLYQTATRAVEIIKEWWPVDTGTSRDAWSVERTADGATIRCAAAYSSYVYRKGDEERVPIYLDLVPWAVQQAADETGMTAALVDVTEAYWGQGRTTARLTGLHRKMIIHTPPKQAEAWEEYYGGAIPTIEIWWKGELVEMPVVPSDQLPAGQGGSWEIRARS